MSSIEQTIRERAYQLWVESGFEHGHAEAHWLAAQREVLSASFAEIGRVTQHDEEYEVAPQAACRLGSEKRDRPAITFAEQARVHRWNTKLPGPRAEQAGGYRHCRFT